MEQLKDSELRSILSKLFIRSLTDPEPAKEIVNQALEDDDFKDQVTLLCKAYLKPEYRNSILISKSIDIRALKSLISACKRQKIGIIPVDFSGQMDQIYTENDQISILVLSGQLDQFNELMVEACAVSGTAEEISRYEADSFARALKEENPLIEVKGVKKDIYEAMKKNMKKLPYEMRFTLFPNPGAKGKVDVSFLSKTEAITMRKGSKKKVEGPFFIPKLASVLLASSILEQPDRDREYEKIKKMNQLFMQDVIDMFYETDDPYFLVPATMTEDSINIFADQAYEVDYYSQDVNANEIQGFITGRFNGLNHLVIPMSAEEFHLFSNEVSINRNQVAFLKEHQIPEYAEPKTFQEKALSESLIDMLNRKREQVLLMSTDFNSKNLTNLDNFITGTVHEFIVREDEDYSNWLEEDELEKRKEIELLNRLDDYKLETVYEDHGVVNEMIKKEALEQTQVYHKVDDHDEYSLE